MTLTVVQNDLNPAEMRCPYHDLPLRRVGTIWRCLKCDVGKVDHEWMPFNGARMRLAREVRGMSVAWLAQEVGLSAEQVEQIEAQATRPDRATQEAIAHLTGFPLAFFMQDDPPELTDGFNSLDLHASLSYCECGAALCLVGERMPLVCPDCLEPTYGCPCCDSDMHTVDRKNTAGDAQRHFVCDHCAFRATTGEMFELWEKGRLR